MGANGHRRHDALEPVAVFGFHAFAAFFAFFDAPHAVDLLQGVVQKDFFFVFRHPVASVVHEHDFAFEERFFVGGVIDAGQGQCDLERQALVDVHEGAVFVVEQIRAGFQQRLGGLLVFAAFGQLHTLVVRRLRRRFGLLDRSPCLGELGFGLGVPGIEVFFDLGFVVGVR